jgi:hypothetical protein
LEKILFIQYGSVISHFFCDQHREVKICTELLRKMQEGGQDSRQPVAELNTIGHVSVDIILLDSQKCIWLRLAVTTPNDLMINKYCSDWILTKCDRWPAVQISLCLFSLC